jgi:pyridoxine kinase
LKYHLHIRVTQFNHPSLPFSRSQVLGIDVDFINSVQLSNHTGYQTIKGQVLSEKDLKELYDGLHANGIHSLYTHLLTGYVRNDEFLREIKAIVKNLRSVNPNLVYVCDPVMGDAGKMYVPESILPIYRDEIVPLADIVTPNQYEVELLTGMTIVNENDAWRGMKWFHDKGVKTVALSSSEIGGEDNLIAFLSSKKPNGELEKYKIIIPMQGPIHLTGTGDLFASLLLAHSSRVPIKTAFELTIASIQSVIEVTIKSMPHELRSGKLKPNAQQRELKIIQSKEHIESPKVKLHAIKVD